MEVKKQSPQPIILCYHSISKGEAVKELYYSFTPTSDYPAGKNLQSYSFDKSIDDFGTSFSFSVKENPNSKSLFMDQVRLLDVIVISESGSQQKIDFIGVVTTVSAGGTASNLNKVVNVSGKSIEWLFKFYNINADIKCVIFNNAAANNTFKTDLAKKHGTEGITIKDIVKESYNMFEKETSKTKALSNFLIGEIIFLWYGYNWVEASDEKFFYPISSNLFDSGKINVIDYIKKLLPAPIYEIFGDIDNIGKPVIRARKAPFDNPVSNIKIDPDLLSDFTLTKSCDEVYTAFMPYIEGSSQSPDFYMNLATAEGVKERGYDCALRSDKKSEIYGYQLLTCSFMGYTADSDNSKETIDKKKLQQLAEQLRKWFENLDEMYTGDFTIVNITSEKHAKIGEWLGFADGLFYVVSEKHTWNYGDNPMINYQVIRGGDYVGGNFKEIKNISSVYKEFE
ncbi:MAG: hypothetical protein J5710_14150 [Treponema sp.]|nr:hypothetical protein [Treponema sp.]